MAAYASPVAKSGAVRRSSDPARRMANSEMFSCNLATSHTGEAGAARPSPAEVLFRSGWSDGDRHYAQTRGRVSVPRAPLSEQVHLRRLGGFDIENWNGW
jgi:hypothetical protein